MKRKKKKEAPDSEWTPQDVMSFAGELLQTVMHLSEHGRPLEKRVCKQLLEKATEKVHQERFQRSMKKVLGGMF